MGQALGPLCEEDFFFQNYEISPAQNPAVIKLKVLRNAEPNVHLAFVQGVKRSPSDAGRCSGVPVRIHR